MKKLLDTLSDKEKQMLAFTECEENEILFRENSICTSLGIVVKGEAAIVSYTYRGNEILYKDLKEGSLFGNNLLFSSSPVYQGNVLAKSKCVFASIRKEILLNLMKRNEQFLETYLEIISAHAKEMNEKIKMLSLSDAEERFLYYLQLKHNHLEYDSISDLAQKLSLRRETLSRVLSRLENNREIERKKRLIVKR